MRRTPLPAARMDAEKIRLHPAATARLEKNAVRDAAARTRARSRRSYYSETLAPAKLLGPFNSSGARALPAKTLPSNVSTNDSWTGPHWHRTDCAFAEILSFDSEGVVEAGAIVFPGDRRRQFH